MNPVLQGFLFGIGVVLAVFCINVLVFIVQEVWIFFALRRLRKKGIPKDLECCVVKDDKDPGFKL